MEPNSLLVYRSNMNKTRILYVEDEVAHNDSCLVEHLLSDVTREKLFEFMKKVSNDPSQLALRTDLHLNDFDNHKVFLEAQKGDKYL